MLGLLVGLLALKATVITLIGPLVGLSKADSIRTGFSLSQGGEFAFVLLALAAQLEVLPAELNKLLIVVVVLSMAVTPLLTETGKRVADIISAQDGEQLSRGSEELESDDPVLVCGFGDVGQAVANMLRTLGLPYVVFDLTVARVQAAQDAGFNVLYGDGSRPKVLNAAGVRSPRAVAIGYTARQRAVTAVSTLRKEYPDVPILVRAIDMVHAAELEDAGATQVVLAEAEAGLAVGSRIAEDLGAWSASVASLANALRADMAVRTNALAEEVAERNNGGAKADGTPGSGGAAIMRSVYRFDGPRAVWEVAGGPGSSQDGEGVTSSGGGGLLASILGAMGSGESIDIVDVTPDKPNPAATIRISSSGRGGASSSSNSSAAAESGDATETLVFVASKGGQESFVLPDGSLECPVDWEDEQGSPAGSPSEGSNTSSTNNR